MDKGQRQIAGVLKIPMIICWIFFGIHFIYIGFYHGIWKKYIDIYDIIIDIYLLFSIEAIAVLLTLSNTRNNFLFFKISLIISMVNIAFILFYIFIVIFSFFVDDKMTSFIDAEDWIKTSSNWKGVLLIIIKVIEMLPLLIIYIYKRILEGSVGTINPQNLDSGGLMNNNNKEEEDELE